MLDVRTLKLAGLKACVACEEGCLFAPDSVAHAAVSERSAITLRLRSFQDDSVPCTLSSPLGVATVSTCSIPALPRTCTARATARVASGIAAAAIAAADAA
eukprot:805914-Pleurochrysis_carterae.AAC.1